MNRKKIPEKKFLSLRVEKNIAATNEYVNTTYTGTHPMLHFKPTLEKKRQDHLDNYVEVHQFENAEPRRRKPGKKKKNKRMSKAPRRNKIVV